MFAPKVAARTPVAEGSSGKLAPQRPIVAAKPFWGGAAVQSRTLPSNIGDQVQRGLPWRQDSRHSGNLPVDHDDQEAARGSLAAPGPSWNLGKIPIYPPAHTNRNEAATKPRDATDGRGAVVSVKVAPVIVHDVLQSPGQALDPPTRAVMEPRLGFDFGQVRVHTDVRAAESAQAVDARAYTVGQHIAFAPGQFAPSTAKGTRLLLHELTHTLQQRRAASPDHGEALEIGPVDDVYEAEANAVASSSSSASRSTIGSPGRSAPGPRLQRQPPDGSIDVDVEQTPAPPGMNLPQVSGATLAAAGGSPYATILPGYSQSGDSCGAASLVSALIIWDREHWKPAEPNSRVVTACNLILTEYVRRGNDAVRVWAARPTPEAKAMAATIPGATVTDVYEVVRAKFNQDLTNIRDTGRQPGAKISESDYQTIGLSLYFLWNQGGATGLSAAAIGSMQSSLGLAENKPGASTNIQSLADLFSSSVVTGLQADQIAQAGWFVKTGQQHAFLIGRLQTGEWFLSDQGPQPAVEFRAPSLSALQGAVSIAVQTGSYWLYGGTVTDYLNAGGVIPGWLGVKLLAPETGVELKAQDVIGSGAFLGEVDAGYLTSGDRVTRGAFIARVYSLADAQARFPASSAGGGVIVELPKGVFSLYGTSAVSSSNVTETSLDADDSKDGVLVRRPAGLLHAWLILGTSSGKHGSWLSMF